MVYLTSLRRLLRLLGLLLIWLSWGAAIPLLIEFLSVFGFTCEFVSFIDYYFPLRMEISLKSELLSPEFL